MIISILSPYCNKLYSIKLMERDNRTDVLWEIRSLEAVAVVGVFVGTAANEDSMRCCINGALFDGR